MKSSVAVDKDGTEVFGATPLVRYNDYWISKKWFKMAQLPKGTIKKVIGKELTWEDEPEEI